MGTARNLVRAAHLMPEYWRNPQKVLRYFYFLENGLGVNRLFATLPRSGYNYLATLLSVAVDIQSGGQGGYAWQGGRWTHDREIFCVCDRRMPLGIRTGKAGRLYDFSAVPLTEIGGAPFIYHSHDTYEALEPSCKASWKTIVLVRDPIEQVESQILHQRYGAERQVDFLVDGFLKTNVAFLNSWGRQFAMRDNVVFFDYSDLVGDRKVDCIQKISNFLFLNIERETIERASIATQKDRMREKIPAEERAANKRVSPDRDSFLHEPVRDYIVRYLEENLREGRAFFDRPSV